MHYHIRVVNQHPASGSVAFNVVVAYPVFLLDFLGDAFNDSLKLAVTRPVANYKIIGDHCLLANIQQYDIFPFFISDQIYDQSG